MHAELYLEKNRKLSVILAVIGGILLTFSFINMIFNKGSFQIFFSFDSVLLAFSGFLLSYFYFQPEEKIHRLAYPHLALLAVLFLRFGSVTIFGREIPFDRYIFYAVFMLAACGYSFLLFFIAEGKLRSRIPLFVWSALMLSFTAVSLIQKIVPFYAYTDITEGELHFGLSFLVVFLLYNLTGILVASFLKDDLVKEERRKKKESQKARK